MALLSFLKGLRASPLRDFWRLDKHDIPPTPGAYLLVARPGVRFPYPAGRSPVFYVGQASSLQRRLRDHLKFSVHVRDNQRVTHRLYWPRYEYAGVYGGRYCFVHTWQGMTPKALEDMILARFAKQYHSFPVANSAGAWNRIEREFGHI